MRDHAGVQTVVVVGGGTMGTGIAHAFALARAEVAVVDAVPGAAEAAVAKARAVLASGVERGKLESAEAEAAAGRLRAAVDVVAATPDGPPDLVVEAVPERVELKQEVLARSEAVDPTVLATNTSSLSLALLGAGLSRPERFVGLHFFNPVWSSALVEVVLGPRTSPETRSRALEHVRAIGKESIVVRDAPGFATSRLGVALGLEAVRMVEEDVASAADIDRAMELGYRHPMGPLRLTDLIGLDVRLDIARGLADRLGPRFTPPALLEDLVSRGHLGRKAGQGFYRWGGEEPS